MVVYDEHRTSKVCLSMMNIEQVTCVYGSP